jgi:hypothetical protein
VPKTSPFPAHSKAAAFVLRGGWGIAVATSFFSPGFFQNKDMLRAAEMN